MVPQVWIKMWIWNLEPQHKPCWFAVYTGWYYQTTWGFLKNHETRSQQRLLFFVVFYVGVSLPGRQTPGRGTPGVERGLEVGDRMFFYGEIENPLKNPSFSNRKCNESLKNGAEFSKWPCLGHVFCVFFWWYIINGVAGVASTSYRSLTFPHVKPHPHFSGFHPFRRNRRSFSDSTRARKLQVVPGSGEVVAIRAKNDSLQIYYTPEFTNMTSLNLSTIMMYFLFKKRWFSMAMLVFGG